tara:strand:+ start:3251 stop:4258 length:1008 start_codon:yes stop_codon:yes gene_type:complete
LTSKITKIFGFSIIGLILIVTTVVSLVFAIGILTSQHVSLSKFHPFNAIQKVYYFGGIVNIWQYQNECVEIGGRLVYQPKIGTCYFENIEFQNTLTFNEAGRKNNFKFDSELPRIAVLGDSHAMGWGVGDDTTFSAQLQRMTNRRVYNLGVSSYATERELDRLALMQNLDDIDTVIIQYCDNDMSENSQYPIDRNLALNRFNDALETYVVLRDGALARNFYTALKAIVPASLKLRLKAILSIDTPTYENQHRDLIERVLGEYSNLLKNKKVILMFVSGSNAKEVPTNWVGSYTEHGLDVSFIDLNLRDDFFYLIDDHLNIKGHAHIATTLSYIIE